MKMVIDIDENVFTRLFDNGTEDYDSPIDLATAINDIQDMATAIRNGTPLPEHHERLIDADALVDSLGASDRDIYCKAVIVDHAPIIIKRSDNE